MYAISTNRPDFHGELCEMARFFWGEVPIGDAPARAAGDQWIEHSQREGAGEWIEELCYYAAGEARERVRCAHAMHGGEKKYAKRSAKLGIYALLKTVTGQGLPWGALTGIRPTRLFREFLQHSPEERVEALLTDGFDVQPEKTALLRDIVRIQAPYIVPEKNEVDVYIGIPFCTTRCSYCSFAAMELRRAKKLVEPYVEALLHEIQEIARDARENGWKARALYMGGGTPTALDAEALERVLRTAMECFPDARECTVEAGRPDTMDEKRLRVLRNLGVNRISVNPQSMNAATLERIGRAHTPEDIVRAMGLARQLGFSLINMDIIAALPGETVEDFFYTLEQIERLRPENLTIHTLAVKRASNLHESGYRSESDAQAMLDLGAEAARRWGLSPYYLYRQKYMAGNLENVGYALPGTECIYNIDIMEETTPILAFGAGAISKWLYDAARRIERAPNVKNVEQYIARIDEMIERKRGLWCR